MEICECTVVAKSKLSRLLWLDNKFCLRFHVKKSWFQFSADCWLFRVARGEHGKEIESNGIEVTWRRRKDWEWIEILDFHTKRGENQTKRGENQANRGEKQTKRGEYQLERGEYNLNFSHHSIYFTIKNRLIFPKHQKKNLTISIINIAQHWQLCKKII